MTFDLDLRVLALAICGTMLAAPLANARQVINPGFETGKLPDDISEIDYAPPWAQANQGTTDYFAVGGTGGAGVPTNVFGSRTPHGGERYAGIHTYATDPDDPDYLFREYLHGDLTTPLTEDTRYLVGFWTCRADGGPQEVLAANRMGVRLDAAPIFELGVENLSVLPNYEYPGVIEDATNWEHITFPYVAIGGEWHIVIGNFRDNAATSVAVLGSTAGGARAYYYVDDVSVDECSQVTNGDFEDGTVPSGLSEITNAVGWYNANFASSDYFAVGGGEDAGVPMNHFGTRTAHSGNAYAGIHTYAVNPDEEDYLFREYLQTQLTIPLTQDSTYLVEFWACRASNSISVLATDKLGALFSTEEIVQADTFDLTQTPSYERPGVLVDSTNWTRVAFLYTAAGDEQYLVIGNFNDNAGTTMQEVGSAPNGVAYYYIDDVSITCVGDVRATVQPCPQPDTVNVDVLTAEPIVIGQDWSATVTVSHAHGVGGPVALKVRPFCCTTPTVNSPLGGRPVKVCVCGPVLAQLTGTHNGTTATLGPLPVPLSLDLVGLSWAAQATVVGGGFGDLSKATGGMVGTH